MPSFVQDLGYVEKDGILLKEVYPQLEVLENPHGLLVIDQHTLSHLMLRSIGLPVDADRRRHVHAWLRVCGHHHRQNAH
jgi:hypothetical protein